MRRSILGASVLLVVAAVATLVALPRPAATQGGAVTMHLDLVDPLPLSAAVPGDCATWHELYPNYCLPHHQDAYVDADGDGNISICDQIVLDGVAWHIVWVGPTYFLTCLADGSDAVHEPEGDPSGGNPMCETWHEIFPEYCSLEHVDDWDDADGDGHLSPCDIVFLAGQAYHLDRIGLDIIVEPGPTALDSSTWGKIKSFFHDLGR